MCSRDMLAISIPILSSRAYRGTCHSERSEESAPSQTKCRSLVASLLGMTGVSSLHCTSSKPLHDAPLKREHDDRNGRRGDDSRGEDLTPGHLILPAKERDRDRHRVPLRSERERQREQELVPAIDERQDRGRR